MVQAAGPERDNNLQKARQRPGKRDDNLPAGPQAKPLVAVESGDGILRAMDATSSSIRRAVRRATVFAAAAMAIVFVWTRPLVRAADTLPTQLSDEAFWSLVGELSEPGGEFQSENFLSNETGFQAVIPRLIQTTPRDAVYLGVGPEQNFTYIAAVRPRIAFILDIRHQNLVEHLMYKALFELSPNRVEFLSRLFGRKRPAGVDETATADELFNAYARMPNDEDAFRRTVQDIEELLLKKHRFALTEDDVASLEHVYLVFHEFGPELNYNSGAGRVGFGRGGGMPTYMQLMTASDRQGEKRSYLASEANYLFMRDLERRNLLVPLTGDFGGDKALRAVGRYVKDHNAIVAAFYLSNVERYLFQITANQNGGWRKFYENVAMLPLDPSSTFIRSVSGGVRGGGFGMRLPNVLASIEETLARVNDGSIRTYEDVFSVSR